MKTLINLGYELVAAIGKRFHPQFRNRRYIVLIGGPGAGKGTVASFIGPVLRLAHVSTGSLIRDEIARKTPLGRRYEPRIKKGKLLPDRVVIAMLRRKLLQPECANGGIIDGLPRTKLQARMLRWMLAFWGVKLDAVVLIEVSIDDLIERLSFRRTCTNSACGRTFHLKFMPPKVADVCDYCGSRIVQRDDETPEAITERVAVFQSSFAELLKYFDELGVLVRVASSNKMKPEAVAESVLLAIDHVQ